MIFLISGHHRANWFHWRDPGAVPRHYNGNEFDPPIYNEHHEAEKLVTQVSKILEQNGLKTTICPFNYNLWQKIRWEKKLSHGTDDLLVSVHYNGSNNPTATGTEVFYYRGSNQSRNKARTMAKILSNTMGLRDRGAKPDTSSRYGRLGIIRDTKSWSFLIEMGFITNKDDMKKVRATGVQALYESIKSQC